MNSEHLVADKKELPELLKYFTPFSFAPSLTKLELSDYDVEERQNIPPRPSISPKKIRLILEAMKNSKNSLVEVHLHSVNLYGDSRYNWDYTRLMAEPQPFYNFACQFLERNTKLQSLTLWDVGLARETTRFLTESLHQNSTLTSLNIGCNCVGDQGIPYIVELLSKPTCRIATLNLHSNDIRNGGAQRLVAGMEKNTTLTSLTLKSFNDVNDHYVSQAGVILERNKKLLSDAEPKV